jgi:hypothetical protein
MDDIDKIFYTFWKDTVPPNRNSALSEIMSHCGIATDQDNIDSIYKKLIATDLFEYKANTHSTGYAPWMKLNQSGLRMMDSFGSYSNFIGHQRQEELESKQLKVREIEAAELSARAAVSSKKAAWASGLLAAIATTIVLLQYIEAKDKDITIQQLQKQSSVLDSALSSQGRILQQWKLNQSITPKPDALKRGKH